LASVEDGRQPQSFLDRPVRSLLDLRIGTLLKAYLVYVTIGLVIALIGLGVILGLWHRAASDAIGGPGNISWSTDAGQSVTPGEYRSVRVGARLDAVRSRFGEPATTGPNPFDQVSGETQTCLGYRSSVSADSALFLFCFDAGRLVEKKML
jgi:hypothetical protein